MFCIQITIWIASLITEEAQDTLHVPEQLNPSPVNPGLHLQGNFADVPLQDEFRLQPIEGTTLELSEVLRVT